MNIQAIPAFNDNYIWAIEHKKNIIVIDPGDSEVVKDYLASNGYKLSNILITHWHHDHTGGIVDLKKHFNSKVLGPRNHSINGLDVFVKEGDRFNILDIEFEIIDIPGHTLDHIGFYAKKQGILFVGDTLFAGGCGRMFEGTPEMFHNSLAKIARLPSSTKVYCAHEYTLSNLEFALAVEPSNESIRNRLSETRAIRKMNKITLPTDIESELQTNPFLRTTQSEVIAAALANGGHSSSSIDVFASLRQWKNNFNG